MKIIFLIVFLAVSISSAAFEIKPEGPNANVWKQPPESFNKNIEKSCGVTEYKVMEAMPVHEIITANAARRFCERIERKENLPSIFYDASSTDWRECNDLLHGDNHPSNNPLLSGSEFNDDPEGILRRDLPELEAVRDYLHASGFHSEMEEKGTLTNRSHYGDLQFLHAMASTCNEKRYITQKNIIDYVAENFNLAKSIDANLHDDSALKSILERPVTQKDYYHFFIRGKSTTVKKLFYPDNQFEHGDLPKNEFEELSSEEQRLEQSTAIALVAFGSALHVIQDSYSTSHVKRDGDDKTANIIKFYHYPNGEDDGGEPTTYQRCPDDELTTQSHCESDQYAAKNGKNIEKATDMSYEFMMQLLEDCDSTESQTNTCKKMIKKWLCTNIFNLQPPEGSYSECLVLTTKNKHPFRNFRL